MIFTRLVEYSVLSRKRLSRGWADKIMAGLRGSSRGLGVAQPHQPGNAVQWATRYALVYIGTNAKPSFFPASKNNPCHRETALLS